MMRKLINVILAMIILSVLVFLAYRNFETFKTWPIVKDIVALFEEGEDLEETPPEIEINTRYMYDRSKNYDVVGRLVWDDFLMERPDDIPGLPIAGAKAKSPNYYTNHDAVRKNYTEDGAAFLDHRHQKQWGLVNVVYGGDSKSIFGKLSEIDEKIEDSEAYLYVYDSQERKTMIRKYRVFAFYEDPIDTKLSKMLLTDAEKLRMTDEKEIPALIRRIKKHADFKQNTKGEPEILVLCSYKNRTNSPSRLQKVVCLQLVDVNPVPAEE